MRGVCRFDKERSGPSSGPAFFSWKPSLSGREWRCPKRASIHKVPLSASKKTSKAKCPEGFIREVFLPSLHDILIDFRERGREGERGRETLISCLLNIP